MNTFSLKLIACDKVFYDGPCEILIFDGFDGEMAIMANHEPMTCSVETGELRFRVPGETVWQEAIVSTGLLKVEHNKVDIIVYSAERPEEIDKFRAEAALERAREQLAQKQSIMEYHVSTASMARAMARLRGVTTSVDVTVNLAVQTSEGLEGKIVLSSQQVVIKAGEMQSEELTASMPDLSFLSGTEDAMSYTFSVIMESIQSTSQSVRASSIYNALPATINKEALSVDNLKSGVPENTHRHRPRL